MLTEVLTTVLDDHGHWRTALTREGALSRHRRLTWTVLDDRVLTRNEGVSGSHPKGSSHLKALRDDLGRVFLSSLQQFRSMATTPWKVSKNAQLA